MWDLNVDQSDARPKKRKAKHFNIKPPSNIGWNNVSMMSVDMPVSATRETFDPQLITVKSIYIYIYIYWMDISFKELTKFTYFMPVSAIDTTFTDEAGIIVRMCSTNERSRYYVTLSLIGRVHAQNDPCDAMRCPQWVQSKATMKPWLTFMQLGFFFQIYLHLRILLLITAIFLHETDPIQKISSQHCGCK